MQTTNNSLLTKYLIKFLSHILPKHGIRAIFLTTLAGEILADDLMLEAVLPLINDKFKLVNDYRVLEFPKVIYTELWENRTINIRKPETIHGDELIGLAERVMRITPQWCNYASHAIVLQDTISMIEFCLNSIYKCRDKCIHTNIELPPVKQVNY